MVDCSNTWQCTQGMQDMAKNQTQQAFTEFSLCTQNCMTKDVVAQLQKISTQQSKIKTLKGKLAVYQDVANKQAETFAELQLVKRVPVAYRHCLAECMRRSNQHSVLSVPLCGP